jgi:hypothetical protein
MRREHQPVNTLLVLMMSVGYGGMGCASGTSPSDGETTGPLQTSNTTSAASSTNTTGPTTTGPSNTSTGATGASGATGATSSAATTTSGTASQTGTSGTASGSSSAGVSETTGPEGSDDHETNSDAGSEGTGGSDDGTEGTGASSETDEGSDSEASSTETNSSEPEDLEGACTASAGTGRNASGSGPHDVVIETNAADGIRCGTIYRPADLGGEERYPIFVWGEGACSQDGYANQAAMAEIASWGYFVVADGTPGSQNACSGRQNGAALLDYITWAIDENRKPCSAYYHSLEPTKVAADGFSCGGLMSENAAGDPRFTAVGITSSGLMGPNDNLWDSMHAPFKIMNGGSSDQAYPNGLNDYDAISSRGIPILYFSKTSAGHGGDLGQGRGDFNLVNLAWLNWQLKGDEGATGKAFLIGPTCEFCNDGGWVFKSANIE